jgi:hypothetical protein
MARDSGDSGDLFFFAPLPLVRAHPNKQRLSANPPTGISQELAGIYQSFGWGIPTIRWGIAVGFSPSTKTGQAASVKVGD